MYTFQDHWRMIAQENVTLVVTTCKEIEELRPKCNHYWPFNLETLPSVRDGQKKLEHWQAGMQSVNIEVTQPDPDILLSDTLVLRKMLLTDNDLGISNRPVY